MDNKPIEEIAGTKFYVNASNETFTEVGNPTNYFTIRDMMIFDDHYRVVFDKNTRRPFEGLIDDEPKNIELVRIRLVEQIDPKGMMDLHTENEMKGLEIHMEGLSKINLGKDTYLLDSNGFREEQNPWNFISYKNLVPGNIEVLYYDSKNKRQFYHEKFKTVPPKKLPDGVLIVILPNQLKVMLESKKQVFHSTTISLRNYLKRYFSQKKRKGIKT